MSLIAILFCVITWGIAPTRAQTVPPEVESSASQWPLPNGDYSSTRAAVNSTITSGNVEHLDVVWTFELPRPPFNFGNAASGPLIVNDTVYFQDLQSNVFALDLDSGNVDWQTEYNSPQVGPNGVAVGWGKVFATSSQTSYAALDLQTGQELWSVTDLPRKSGERMTVPPTVFDDTVYLGTLAGSRAGATGRIYALDPRTGETRWHFDTVDSDDIWGNPDVNSGGGIWYTPSVDVDRGVIYSGIGNPYPYPGTNEFPNGSSRPGPNLYTNSVVALDHRSGELQWFNQARPNDLFDLDFQLSPVLATVSIDGIERDIVIGAGKLGRVIAFDRDTGETLWDTPVGVHLNDELTELPPGETVVFPGALGGVLTPVAYADGVVYAPVVNRGDRYTTTAHLTGDPSAGVDPVNGELTAIAADTGDILWTRMLDAMAMGGATVVNDLVFTSTLDGMIYALDRATGEDVWTYQAPGGINGWPAVAGHTILFPIGIPTGAEPPQLIAFSLPELQAGDADQDFDFDQFDIIQISQRAKYLTGQPATWGDGDWNGAPGGGPGRPPAGDGLFNQFDIIASQQGAIYLTGAYVALQSGGRATDGQTSVGYDVRSGEIWVDAPAGNELTSIYIDSGSGIFTGADAANLGGSFDNDADDNIFKATFGASFGSLTFGTVAQAGLSEEFLLNDLSVIGSLQGGGGLGDVDLIYVPEPGAWILMAVGLAALFVQRPRARISSFAPSR